MCAFGLLFTNGEVGLISCFFSFPINVEYCAVPLPDEKSRESLIRHLLGSQKYSISSREMATIVKLTDGYSGSDLKALCKDAAMGPIRELGARIREVQSEDVRGVNASDFKVAVARVRPSVSRETVNSLLAWNELYGVSAVDK